MGKQEEGVQLLVRVNIKCLRPLSCVDPLGLFEVRVGGTSVGVDYSITLYDSNRGWFPDTVTRIGRSTTLGGGGLSFVFDTGVRASNVSSCDEVGVSVGLGSILGSALIMLQVRYLLILVLPLVCLFQLMIQLVLQTFLIN